MSDMFQAALEYEKEGGRLCRYSTDGLGAWVRKQQTSWVKLTLEQKVEMRRLKAFANFNPATFEDLDRETMMRACEEFELKTGEMIAPKDVYSRYTIGQWLTDQKKFMRRCEDARQRGHKHYARLARLKTIQHWDRTRKKTWADEFNQDMDDLHARFGFKPRAGDAHPTKSPTTVSHYEVLQIHPTASIDVVKAAYRALALTKHPDKGGPHDAWVRVQAAYDILVDPNKRRRYDQTLHSV